MTDKPTIGFIGQGFIGKNYADDFENRGFPTVRYSLEKEYRDNRDHLKECDIIFVAVPTPTTPDGFDDSILKAAIAHAPDGSIVVIKSTVLPGTTELIQEMYPGKIILHSPEFLTEATATHDAAHPERNIIGIAGDMNEQQAAAKRVLSVLPAAPYSRICTAREAELTKYGGNNFLFFKVVYINMLYDAAQAAGADWSVIKENISADPRIGASHMEPVHQSGRGAGGHCFIKDFAAFTGLYEREFPGDTTGIRALRALACKNTDLLVQSGKDIDLLEGVYGNNPAKICDF